MKNIILPLLLLSISVSVFGQKQIENYDFKFKINNLTDSTDSAVYLANYYGKKQYYYDTAVIEKGIARFKGKKIKGGIYSIIMQDRKSYFEFVVNEPKVDMETTAGDLVASMKVKESHENLKFYEYLNYIEGKSQEVQKLKTKQKTANEADKEKIDAQLGEIDKAVVAFKKEFISGNPDLFISKVFAASAEPEVADYKEIKDEDERNKKRYREFKKHYLDGVDFTDERLLRTPVLYNKFHYYLTKLTPQSPDSVIATADLLVERCDTNKETQKFVIHTITSKYEDSKIMGMDAVLVHMGQTYYCPNKAWWLSEDKLEKFCERVNAMAPLLIGNTAPNLILQDTTGAWQNLHKVDARYTVLYFWDSGCGHCKKVTPKLKEFYAEFKQKGVEVFAVGTEFENKDWKKYIRKNELPWTNVSDTPEANENAQELMIKGVTTVESLNFRDTYDIFSTPKIYLLDENKKIIAVKLMPEQLGEYIDHMLDEEMKESLK